MTILGIESSCDETAAAVVRDGREILSNVIESQVDIHSQYGGVVPEIASRSHLEAIIPVIDSALSSAELDWDDIDAIGVTSGPGLSGSLLIGTMSARTLAWLHQKPIYGINHVLGHVYANFLEGEEPVFPLLALIVSGGHTQLALFRDHLKYELLGQTQDDAIGEAFDKVAKMLGLPYPGGPSIAQAALEGDQNAFGLPTTKLANDYDFSFSGLKTAVLRSLQAHIKQGYDFPSYRLPERLSSRDIVDMAASFQHQAVTEVVKRLVKAQRQLQPSRVVIAGGVAANQHLREQIVSKLGDEVRFVSPALCTDNAAMIAGLTYFVAQNTKPDDINTLGVNSSLSMQTI